MKTGWNIDNSYARLPKLFFASQNPVPVIAPELVVFNNPLAESLGLNVQMMQSKEGIAVLAGNRIPEGAMPLAQAYAGHQFGYFTMLGDGRTLLLGEQITPAGDRFDIQLKGSGPTPYSRRGDGRGTLGSMLREYIISEAMYALGIATTRSLAVVASGESVIREVKLPGAILTRVASSHLRVGTFQYVSQYGTVEELRILADYALARHFPDVEQDDSRYLSLLKEVVRRQAGLIAKWQMAGFIHGVMNTDNMTISGETIDYGPCAFMDEYNPEAVFSSIDLQGRYAYGNQPHIAAWNLARLAEALLPILHVNQAHALELAQDAILGFAETYKYSWLTGMRAKLGICSEEVQDESLIDDLLTIMEKAHADYTNTFRALTFERPVDTNLYGTAEYTGWYERWQARLGRQKEGKSYAHQLMQGSNPEIIPRNHRVEAALEAAVNHRDFSVMKRLLGVLADPYKHTLEQKEYTAPPAFADSSYRTFCGT